MPSDAPAAIADVNLWLATVVEGHPHHEAAIAWWRDQVLPARRRVCFCRITQLGFLRLLSNETVMGPLRRTPDQAWSDYDRLESQGLVGYLDEPTGLTEELRRLASGQVAAASLWTDAYLAAFARASDVELVTFDRGFREFREVRLTILP